jgi:threo-3-hydroxy-L-aspartate ammonia-lyase
MSVTFDDVQSAAAQLAGHAHLTPVATSRSLDEACGAPVFLKCENLQRIGAFKFRGAWNAISRLTAEERARGVIAYSSGNHGQAVAFVSRLLEAPATIVMPATAARIKRDAAEAFGATVVPYDPKTESREAVSAAIQHERRLTLIPPFDHPHVIAGQGTAALELHGQQPGLETLLVPVGGGGLLTGSAIASLGVAPGCRVIGVEPELGDDATRSFRTKTLQTIDTPATIADGTRTTSMGALTFPLMLAHVADMVTVSEEAIIDAVRFLFLRLKLVVEPSGALGVAALLSGAVKPTGRVGVLLSGGNIDPETMAMILTARR